MRKLLILCLLLAKIVLAQNTYVFYINGIMTTYGEAIKNEDKIKSILGLTHKSQNLIYKLAYNQTKGAVSDILDFYAQKVAEKKATMPNLTIEQENQYISDITSCISGDCPSSLLENEVRNLQVRAIEHSKEAETYEDNDSINIRNTIKSSITNNENIFVVSHSQGTMYANIVYEKLVAEDNITKEKIKLFSVAEMANNMPNGDWESSTNDLVLSFVRLVFETLLPNVNEINNAGHSLIDTYLKDGSELLRIFKEKANALLDTFEEIMFDGNVKVVFHNTSTNTLFAGLTEPDICKGYYPMWMLGYSFSYKIIGNDYVYTQQMPLTTGTYKAGWLVNNIPATTATLYCGSEQVTIPIAPYSMPNFGNLNITNYGNGRVKCTISQ